MTAKQWEVMNRTWEQTVAVWKERQVANRAAGLPFYERLVDPVSGKVMATIDD